MVRSGGACGSQGCGVAAFLSAQAGAEGSGEGEVAAARKLGIRFWILLRDQIDYQEFCRRGQLRQNTVVPMRECLLDNMILHSRIESLNRRRRLPEVRGVRRTHHGQQGPKRCLVGNTETMKGMGRAGRANVKTERSRKGERTINQTRNCADTRCAQENKELRRNVLDGADFVRDVIDIYLKINVRLARYARPCVQKTRAR